MNTNTHCEQKARLANRIDYLDSNLSKISPVLSSGLRMSTLHQWAVLFLLFATTWEDSWARRRRRNAVRSVVNDISRFPWNARLAGVDCSASILDRNMVMTAAHCVCNQPLTALNVTVGSTLADGNKPLEMQAARVLIHPNFTTCNKTDENDIAFIYTTKPIPFGRNVGEISICHPQCFRPSKRGALMGFGSRPGKVRALKYGWGRVEICGNKFCVHDGMSQIYGGDDGGPLVIPCGSSRCQLAVITSSDENHNIFFAKIRTQEQFLNLLFVMKSLSQEQQVHKEEN